MSQQDEQYKKEQIVEDAPRMRSVAMMSRAPVTAFQPQQQSAFSLKTTTGGGVVGSKDAIYGHPATKSAPFAVKLDAKPATIKSWNVTNISSIPPYYQLDRTHVIVSSDVSVPEVTKRLMDVFHSESIAVVYDDDEAKATAETKECVKFAVRLWNSSSNQVIVECQRSAGCSLRFCKTAKKVLRAARDGEKKSSSDDNKKTLSKTIPSAVRGCVPNIPVNHMEDSVKDCLELACDMIRTGHLDSQQLAIESLLHVSSSYKTEAFCAMLILSNDIVLSTLISLVVDCCLNGYVSSSSTEIEQECFSVMRRHSLTVLANCFTTLSASKAFENVLAEKTELVEYNFLKTLVLSVASAATKPHEAADACKCLQMLCLHSNSAKQRVSDFGASMYLEHAQHCRHATLNDASMKLMVALSS